MIEIAIWAAFYFGNSLFSDFETALYFSTTSYTTIGFGDVVLPRAWRMLGGIEGVTGRAALRIIDCVCVRHRECDVSEAAATKELHRRESLVSACQN
jgi:hypothetical protein